MGKQDADNQDKRLDEAVQEFLALGFQGEKPNLDEFVKQYPGLERQIKQKLHACQKVGSLFDSLRETDASEFREFAEEADLVGQKIGAFKITEIIGRGGMGVVYKGYDSRLNRVVAVKAMPAHLLKDTSAQARFRREARLLASLSHPNIGAIHDIIEQGDRVDYLILEYVPGQTLAERLAIGPMKIPEALSVALKIAEAVAAAHENGAIHRDLKPSNIKITPEGKVKVLDFGLAKAAPLAGADPQNRVTKPGRVVGTPAYMSPEQARGKSADRRADIWSFGSVLYEMLTGRLPFEGETATDTLARIIEREPDWDLFPPTTPKNIRVLLRRCLTKDLSRRLQHMGDAVIELDETLNVPQDDSVIAEPLGGRSRRILWRVGIACTLAGLTIVLIAAVLFFRGSATHPSTGTRSGQVRKFSITLPVDQVLFFQSSTFGNRRPAFSLSPDGSRLVYIARIGQTVELFERRIGQFTSKPVPGTNKAVAPFFSPDGESVGFFDDEGYLRVVSLLGGEPVTICSKAELSGGSWGIDGMIYFFIEGVGLARVPSTGGDPEPLGTESELVKGNYPQILPGCKEVLISSAAGVSIFSLENRKSKMLIPDGYYARYIPTGYLVYARAGAIEAVPFSLTTRELTGRPVPVLEGIQLNSVTHTAQFAFSDEGMLVYVPGGDIRKTIPTWVDREGHEKPLAMPARNYGSLKLSPNGKRLAITAAETELNIYVYDITQEREIRLAEEGNNSRPIWTPDGRRILFTHQSEQTQGLQGLYWASADGSGEAERLACSGGSPWSWSPDGKWLALHGKGDRPGTSLDLYLLSMEDLGKPKVILETEFIEWGPSFSPDGRWLAYSSNQGGGTFQIYVRPYPAMDRIIPISREFGEEPIWSRGGDELFYRNKNKWMVVSISTEPEFVASTPKVLFEGPYGQVGGLSYDAAPDGQKFLVLLPEYDDSKVRELHVVTNWFEELKELAPLSENR
jgi:serine/threonine protein kinase/WD40 repeat protein